MKVLTDSTGENAKAVNPHKNQFGGIPLSGKGYANWSEFDKANPSLPLTERQLPNVIIELDVVWQYLSALNGWVDAPAVRYDEFEKFEDYSKDSEYFNIETRQAYNPIAPIDEEKGLEDANVFVPIICGETCGCKYRGKCSISKGNPLNTPLRIDQNKKLNAITYEQILTLPNNEYGHKYQAGYDNIDGNYNYFGTSPDAMRVLTVNADYVGHTFVNIKKDGGTRTVFNGHVRSFEELELINSLVL